MITRGLEHQIVKRMHKSRSTLLGIVAFEWRGQDVDVVIDECGH